MEVMVSILKVILGAGTGLSGVGAFVFYSVYSQWLSIDILSNMNPGQAYDLARLSFITTFVFALVLVILHQASKSKGGITADNGGIAVNSSGKNNNINIGK
ncbi:hypothetical protein ACSHBR_004138 [Vibrio alginolyticus]|nr:hypothetical protein [Vibrio alginolyticus]